MGAVNGKPVELLEKVTDPYLNWWRKNLKLQIGYIDMSPIAAIASLSLIQNICINIAGSGKISIGIVLSIVLRGAWSVALFILGFFIIILILRLFAYLTNRDIFSSFWKVIDSISQPVLYRLNRIFFGNHITNYLTGIIVSVLALLGISIVGGIIVHIIVKVFAALPV
jgi:YggT family protein